ncbi:MAG: CDF family Co(II)/Ni(II) efflux transporter DmeF [Sphaerochaetaceae bacterium]|nr:CDF family Co(II)/Ni(II) efflux transporter DmeF [Sphaerochaetaceae bacterium]
MKQRICNQQVSEDSHTENMRRTAIVVLITLITMLVEILYGLLTSSMALLADGIHMGTHTFALIVTLIAYRIAQSQQDNPKFAFSSGKVGILGGYTNAILLGVTALYMMKEAVERLITPQTISFAQALTVAIIGLLVNLASALLLSGKGHHHSHTKEHHMDHNLRSAYVHVLTDALTSVLAIAALLSGLIFDQSWPDALVAILGALVILRWAWGLLKSSGRLLVDYHDMTDELIQVNKIAEASHVKVLDLHIWNTSEYQKAMVLTIRAGNDYYKKDFIDQIRRQLGIDHITVACE